MKLIHFPDKQSLIESFQANEIKFAFCNQEGDGYAMLHPFVKCREYFNEFLMKNHHPEEFEFTPVFGFQYDYEQYPYDLSKTRLALKFPNAKTMNEFCANLDTLHKIEEITGVEKTEYHLPEGEKNTLVVIGADFWVKKCILLNIYTWILKLCSIGFGKLSFSEMLNIRKTNASMPSEVSYLITLGQAIVNKAFSSLVELAHANTKYVDGTDELRCAQAVHSYSGVVVCNTGAYKQLKTLNEIFKSWKNSKPTIDFFEKASS